jgi:hypothetical protein
MKHVPGLRTAAVAVAAAVAAVIAAVPAAQAASTPAWKVDKAYPAGDALGSLSPVSTRDVWGAGQTPAGILVTRWNGAAWQNIPSPTGVTSATVKYDGDEIVGTSPSNAWLFVATYTSGGHKGATVAEHWTGHSWAKDARFPASLALSAAVAPSADSVWAFGDSYSGGAAYAEHYNGKTWTRVSFPGVAPFQVSAVSATDIWAMSTTATTPKTRILGTIEHWNGTQWKTAALPRLTVPSKPAPHDAFPYGIVALGPNNVWAEFGVGVGATNSEQLELAHLTTHGWSVSTPPSSLSLDVDYLDHAIGANAKSGIWLVGEQFKDKSLNRVFVHVAGSTWKVAAAPGHALINSIAAVPGSGDLLALGGSLVAPQPTAVIVGYGI